jgi:pilus assembly protein CpaC
MKHALFFAIALGTLAVAPGARAQHADSAVPQNGQSITLSIGETRVISAKGVKNYSEGAPGIIEVKVTPDGNQFVINGKHQGSTTLLLIKDDGSQVALDIDVFMRAPQIIERELAQLLEGLAGVQVRRVGAHIVIDGTVADEGELKRVQHVASLYPNQVDSLVTVPGAGHAASGLPGELPQALIRIDFYFVQYDADSTYAVGIAWPGSIGGAALASSFNYDFLTGAPHTATATLTNQPLPRLDIAATRGWAKVLKQATVVTNNGVEASFENGGEQNFSITTGLGVGVQKIPFGTELTVLPKYDPQQRQLDIRVSADVSDLTASVAGTSLPGRNTSKVLTHVSLRLGQSLVLSGIHRETNSHTVTGIPILKDIPVLGILFASHGDEVLATEGAVFIVPSVIEPISTSASEFIEAALQKFRKYDGDWAHTNAYDRTPPVPRN